ncbi:hypothetical protein XENOCAPTIV_004006, partial [Xenoophorus captivus]
WWSERQQAAAGLPVSDRSDQGCCQDAWKLHPRPVSCSLPEPQPELMEELEYAELPQEQAQILLTEYKEEAHRLLPPVIKPDKKPRWSKKRRHLLGPPPLNRMQWTAVPG